MEVKGIKTEEAEEANVGKDEEMEVLAAECKDDIDDERDYHLFKDEGEEEEEEEEGCEDTGEKDVNNKCTLKDMKQILAKKPKIQFKCVCVICRRGFHADFSLEKHVKYNHKIGMKMYEAVEYGVVDREDIYTVPLAEVLETLQELGDNPEKKVLVEPECTNRQFKKASKKGVKRGQGPKLSTPIRCPVCDEVKNATEKVGNILYLVVEGLIYNVFQ